MSDRPINFRAPEVRALLDGRKVQDRRVLKHPLIDIHRAPSIRTDHPYWIAFDHPLGGPLTCVRLPYAVGDRLWVREQCATWVGTIRDVVYRADETAWEWDNIRHDAALGHWKLRSPIFCPRWASRLTLIVTDVRVERLNSLTDGDAIAEGIDVTDVCAPSVTYAKLWDDLNSKRGFPWRSNPWVVALTFRTELNSGQSHQ